MSGRNGMRTAMGVYEAHRGPMMTPMVDVVMVILIFFMASTVFLGPEWFLDALLPAQRGPSVAEVDDPFALPTVELRVVLGVSEDGRVLATGAGMTSANVRTFGEHLIELGLGGTDEGAGHEAPAAVLLIDAASNVPYEAVVAFVDECKRIGVREVAIGSE